MRANKTTQRNRTLFGFAWWKNKRPGLALSLVFSLLSIPLVLMGCSDDDGATCDPGAFIQCEGTEIVICGTDGKEHVHYDCGDAGCNADTQQCNDCDPSQQFSCLDGAAVECDQNGEILSAETCPWGCYSDGSSVGCYACTPSQLECHQGDLITCSDTGNIVNQETCEFGCNEIRGECNECVPGDIACQGDFLVACDAEGLVSQQKQCTEGCSSETLQCLCVQNTTFCDGDVMMSCDENGNGEPLHVCPFGCHLDRGECRECEPETTTCEGNTLVECDGEGLIESEIECGLGCNDSTTPNRCFLFSPTNLDASDLTAGNEDFDPAQDVFINTTDKTVTVGTSPLTVSNRTVPAGDPQNNEYYPGIWVLRFRNITIAQGVTVRVVGDRAVAFVAGGDIHISGQINASAEGVVPGPGGRAGDSPGDLSGDGEPSPQIPSCEFVEPGAGGAGLGGHGGQGGYLLTYGPGANGGQVSADELLSPIVGGNHGGNAASGGGLNAGAGGGAVILAAAGQIHFHAIAMSYTGTVRVSGGGGIASGAGGGSGGSILIEAPKVAFGGHLGAKGGGGACGTISDAAGQDGRYGGAGCTCSQPCGSGGDGGDGQEISGGQGVQGECNLYGGPGGGGGGAGRVRINVAPYSGSLSLTFLSTIAAKASYGYLTPE